MKINVKTARNSLSVILDRVERGEEIVLTRRGKQVATLIPPERKQHLPGLKEFRDSIQTNGPPLSEMLVHARDEERY